MRRIEKIVRGKATTKRYQAWLRCDKELDRALTAYQITIVKAQQEIKSTKAYEKALEKADARYITCRDHIHARYAKYGFR